VCVCERVSLLLVVVLLHTLFCSVGIELRTVRERDSMLRLCNGIEGTSGPTPTNGSLRSPARSLSGRAANSFPLARCRPRVRLEWRRTGPLAHSPFVSLAAYKRLKLKLSLLSLSLSLARSLKPKSERASSQAALWRPVCPKAIGSGSELAPPVSQSGGRRQLAFEPTSRRAAGRRRANYHERCSCAAQASNLAHSPPFAMESRVVAREQRPPASGPSQAPLARDAGARRPTAAAPRAPSQLSRVPPPPAGRQFRPTSPAAAAA